MNAPKVIIKILYNISFVWIIAAILAVGLNIYFLFSKNHLYYSKTKNSSAYFVNLFKNGYPIPMLATVQLPSDSIIKFKNKSTNTSGEYNVNIGQDYRHPYIDSILNDTINFSKSIALTKWVVTPPIHMSKNFEIIDSTYYERTGLKAVIQKSYFFDSLVSVKSNNNFKNFAFALFYLLGIIFNLIIAINSFMLLKKMVRHLKFITPINKFIFNIGFTIVIWQLCKLLLCITYSKWYGAIIVDYSTINTNNNNYKVQFNPTIDFNFYLILLGAALIVLAYLFKHGANLEQEQALTI